MKPRRFRCAFAFALVSLVSGCGGTLGPFVTDVRWGNGGELLVTRCMLDVTSGGNVTTYKMHDCKRTTQAPPSAGAAAEPAAAVPSPANSSANVVH